MTNLVLDFFNLNAHADYPVLFQPDFQDSASVYMEGIIDLHDYIMLFLLVIFGLVLWLLIAMSSLSYFSPLTVFLSRVSFLISWSKSREQISRRLWFMAYDEAVRQRQVEWLITMRDRHLKPDVQRLFDEIKKARKW